MIMMFEISPTFSETRSTLTSLVSFWLNHIDSIAYLKELKERRKEWWVGLQIWYLLKVLKKMPGQTFSPSQKHTFLKPTHKLSLKMQFHKGAMSEKEKNECPTEVGICCNQSSDQSQTLKWFNLPTSTALSKHIFNIHLLSVCLCVWLKEVCLALVSSHARNLSLSL